MPQRVLIDGLRDVFASLAPIARFVLYAVGAGFVVAAGNAFLVSGRFEAVGQHAHSSHNFDMAVRYTIVGAVLIAAAFVWRRVALHRRRHAVTEGKSPDLAA